MITPQCGAHVKGHAEDDLIAWLDLASFDLARFSLWRHETERRVLGRSFSLFSPYESINANYLINEASFQIYFCFRTLSEAKVNFVPKGSPIGFERAEKNANKQTHIFVFI